MLAKLADRSSRKRERDRVTGPAQDSIRRTRSHTVADRTPRSEPGSMREIQHMEITLMSSQSA